MCDHMGSQVFCWDKCSHVWGVVYQLILYPWVIVIRLRIRHWQEPFTDSLEFSHCSSVNLPDTVRKIYLNYNIVSNILPSYV